MGQREREKQKELQTDRQRDNQRKKENETKKEQQRFILRRKWRPRHLDAYTYVHANKHVCTHRHIHCRQTYMHVCAHAHKHTDTMNRERDQERKKEIRRGRETEGHTERK